MVGKSQLPSVYTLISSGAVLEQLGGQVVRSVKPDIFDQVERLSGICVFIYGEIVEYLLRLHCFGLAYVFGSLFVLVPDDCFVACVRFVSVVLSVPKSSILFPGHFRWYTVED